MAEVVVSDDHQVVREQVSRILSESSQSTGFVYSPEPLSLTVKQGDVTVGGLTGTINWDWLYIETLAVESASRSQGLARELVCMAERIAQDRGCAGIWVDTFSFQAPEFYIRLGYEAFGELPDYPAGQQRIFLRKLLK